VRRSLTTEIARDRKSTPTRLSAGLAQEFRGGEGRRHRAAPAQERGHRAAGLLREWRGLVINRWFAELPTNRPPLLALEQAALRSETRHSHSARPPYPRQVCTCGHTKKENRTCDGSHGKVKPIA
jgi:hypothetical protein